MKTLTIPASLDSLSALGQFVQDVAAEAGLPKLAAYRVRLAVDEIATNAILYGGAGEAGGRVLDARGEVTADAVTITVEDAGAPFDPRRLPPPDIDVPVDDRPIGGLGVFLALSGVDHFTYERVGDRNRNIFVVNRTATTQPGMTKPDRAGGESR
jgi:anti-sigma regulatory factor (Ser/Thr protein kinase)